VQKNYEVGQSWSYETMPGFESSRILIGAIETIPEVGDVICITLTNAPMPKPDGSAPDTATIPFIPFARDAIDQSVIKLDGDEELPEHFADLLANWMEETEGDEFLPVSVPVFLDMLASGSRG
jgi:hypothetical protein